MYECVSNQWQFSTTKDAKSLVESFHTVIFMLMKNVIMIIHYQPNESMNIYTDGGLHKHDKCWSEGKGYRKVENTLVTLTSFIGSVRLMASIDTFNYKYEKIGMYYACTSRVSSWPKSF